MEEHEAVSENTVFEIGSITKVFTTFALMDMVAKKRFSWTTRLNFICQE